MNAPRCDRTRAWLALTDYFEAHGKSFDLRNAFAREPQRFQALSLQAPDVFADLSKNHIDVKVRELLLDLGRECEIESRRDAMFSGQPLNTTEDRAVLHTALRAPKGKGPHSELVHGVLDAMLAYAQKVRDTRTSGITTIVHIGIGGSDLGPQMLLPALDAVVHQGLKFHFVSNVDGHDIAPVLRQCKPSETLFIIASKTFTTQETMANAQAARAWFFANGGINMAKHFVATTTNVAAAGAFGISTTFAFWDWVGGRYSLWSAVGLPIALAIGAEQFRLLLAGAFAMDEHFAHAPLEKNLPVQLGLQDVWYRNFYHYSSRSVAPYHQGLKRLPAYLQQLEMESNGKRVDLAGDLLPYATSPVVWGEPGTNGQHAYFQLLHQGSDVIPVEFVLVKRDSAASSEQDPHLQAQLERQHRMLLANGVAQSQALMRGKTTEQALTEKAPTASRSLDAHTLACHRTFPGNRPSTTLLLDALTPHSLGALIALYEHRVFVSGAIWGINSFDQWGVELGKALCNDLLPRFADGDRAGDTSDLDGSTAGLIAKLCG